MPSNERGAALLLFAVLLGLGALYLIVGQLGSSQLRSLQDQRTAAALVQAKEALLAYAVTYRDTHAGEAPGYLPCPDLDGDGSADATVCGGSDDKVVAGLLPFIQLGLPDFRDGSGTCFWYVVSGTFKASTNKLAPMNWDTQGRLSVLDAAGNTVAAPEDAQGGAAAAIIAAGPPLSNQDRSSDPGKVCGMSAPSAVSASYLDGGYAFPAAAGTTVALRAGQAGNDANNDRLTWITPREIFERIKRRPDFAGQLTSLVDKLKTSLDTAFPDPQNAQQLGDKKIGELPPAVGVPPDWATYRDNWRDQFRYVKCASPPPTCLTVNGNACRGALIFAGERPNPGPRTVADKADLETYLDAANVAAYVDNNPVPPAYAFTGAASITIPDPRSPASGDVVACLP